MKKMLSLLIVFLIPVTTELSAAIYLEPTVQFKPIMESAAIYIEYNGKILLLHRQDHIRQGGKWGCPAGKMESNETPLQAVIREVYEETGYEIAEQTIEFLNTFYVEYSENGHFVHHKFRAKLQENPAAVQLDFNEHKGFTWVRPAEALQMNLVQDEDFCIKVTYFSENLEDL